MSEEPIGCPEDRRTLLGIYSSSLISFAQLTLAFSVALFSELGLYFQGAIAANVMLRGFIFGLMAATVFVTVILFDSYLVQRRSIFVTLQNDRPVPKALFETVMVAKNECLYDKKNDPGQNNGLMALDAYYTCKTRLECRRHLTARLVYRGVGWVLLFGIAIFFLAWLFY